MFVALWKAETMLKGVTPSLVCCYEVNMCLYRIWILNPFLLFPQNPKPLTWGSGWDTVLLVMHWAPLETAVPWAVWEHPDLELLLDAAELPCSAAGLLPSPTSLSKMRLHSCHNVHARSDWAGILADATSCWLYCATGNEKGVDCTSALHFCLLQAINASDTTQQQIVKLGLHLNI